MSDDFYVYLHRRADDGSVFYVGKGKGRRAWATYNRNKHWKNIVAKHGVAIEIIFTGDETSAFATERSKIAELKSSGIRLANLTDGGEGLSNPDPEILARRNAAIRATNSTPEARARRRDLMLNHYKDPRAKEARRAALVVVYADADIRRRMSETMKRSHSKAEVKSKISEATRDALARPGTRERHSASVKSAWQDEAKRERIVRGQRRRNTEDDPFAGIVPIKRKKGVRFRACIKAPANHGGKFTHLGVFTTLEEAQAARRSAEIKMWGH